MKQYLIWQRWDQVQDKGFKAIIKLVILLLILFLIYWTLPSSRDAHFEREGTLELAILKALIPVIVFTITIVISVFFVHKQAVVPKLKFANSVYFPSITFGMFVVFPSFLSILGYHQILDLYYKIFRISNLKPTFGDLRTILYGISCETVNDLGDVIDCDPRSSKTIWNYPTFLLKLREFNISIEALPYWVIFSTLATFFTIHLVSRRLSAESRMFFALAVCSPPMILCYERMNFDITIGSLLILSAFILEKSNCSIKSTILSFVGLSIASALKFYALPVFFIAVLYVLRVNRKSALLGLFISVMTVSILFQDLSGLSEYVGKDLRGSVGFPVLVSLLRGSETAGFGLYSLPFFTVVVAIIFAFLIVSSVSLTSREINASPVLIFPIFAFLTTYFSSSSYYYRLLLLVFVLPFIYEINNKISFWVSVLTLCSTFYSPSTLGLVMNLFLLPMVAFGLRILADNLDSLISGRSSF